MYNGLLNNKGLNCKGPLRIFSVVNTIGSAVVESIDVKLLTWKNQV